MNYIAEIRAFYDWLIQNRVSATAQALWHRLMAYCNAFGWIEEFTISNTRLTDDLGISRQELDRLRNVLCQKGIVIYKKGRGGKCGAYKMVSLSQRQQHSGAAATSGSAQYVTSEPASGAARSGHEALPLNKLNINKTKQGIKENPLGFSKGAPEKQKTAPPTAQEVMDYCQERSNSVDAVKFVDYYTARGWLIGKNKMKDWRAAVRMWERSGYNDDAKGSAGGNVFLDMLRREEPR